MCVGAVSLGAAWYEKTAAMFDHLQVVRFG